MNWKLFKYSIWIFFSLLIIYVNFPYADCLGSRLPDYGGGGGGGGGFVSPATENLDMDGYDLENSGEIEVGTITAKSGVADVRFSTDVTMANDLTVGEDLTVGGDIVLKNGVEIVNHAGDYLQFKDSNGYDCDFKFNTNYVALNCDRAELRLRAANGGIVSIYDGNATPTLQFNPTVTTTNAYIQVKDVSGPPNPSPNLVLRNLDTGDIEILADANTDVLIGDGGTDDVKIADNGLMSFTGVGQVTELPVSTITTPSGVGNVHFSTDVTMANDLTVTGAGAMATINTGNGDCEVYGQDTFSWSVMLDSATTNYLGALQVVMPSFEHAITISSITFCTNSGTVDGVEVEWVSDVTPFAAGTDVLTGTINVGTGARYGDASGFADATIAASNSLVLKSTGTTGTPTALWGRFSYSIDR